MISQRELFSKTGQCSTTITKLLAELEWTVPLGETCRDYHSRFKGCCLILSGTSSQERAMVSIWKCNLAAFQRFQFSFLSLDFYCRMMRFSSPFPFSSWRPQLDAFYNCFRGNLNLFDRYIALSTIFMFYLPWFIDVNFIFIGITQFGCDRSIHPSHYGQSSIVKTIFKLAQSIPFSRYLLYKFANNFC